MNLSGAIVGHLVGDYLLQNDWMAEGKKRSSWICALHAYLWTFSVCWFAGWKPIVFNANYALAAVILFLTHFIQDRAAIVPLWMDFIGQRKFRTGPTSPWSIIVVDNVWHIVVIWVVWKWII